MRIAIVTTPKRVALKRAGYGRKWRLKHPEKLAEYHHNKKLKLAGVEEHEAAKKRKRSAMNQVLVQIQQDERPECPWCGHQNYKVQMNACEVYPGCLDHYECPECHHTFALGMDDSLNRCHAASHVLKRPETKGPVC